jgi:16S rRNA (adenine(1408)-N(1))-methyltransferase
VTVDVGTGDGRAVLAAAAREPRTLVIGLDPVAAAMAEASRRAARAARRGGLRNAMFVTGTAASIPAPLRGLAAQVTVRFPWASLLRGCLGADETVACGVASLVAAGGTLELLLAPAARDRLDGLPTEAAAVLAAARATFERQGLGCLEARDATADEIRSSGSTWAKRLLAGNGSGSSGSGGAGRGGSRATDRRPVLVRLRRP